MLNDDPDVNKRTAEINFHYIKDYNVPLQVATSFAHGILLALDLETVYNPQYLVHVPLTPDKYKFHSIVHHSFLKMYFVTNHYVLQ
jgi:hypothetical protein